MVMVNLTEQQWLLWKVFFYFDREVSFRRSKHTKIYTNVLFSFHQLEGLPVKTDNGVRRPIRSSHKRKFLGVHIFLLHFAERKIEDMEPYFLKCEVSLSFPGIQIISEYII